VRVPVKHSSSTHGNILPPPSPRSLAHERTFGRLSASGRQIRLKRCSGELLRPKRRGAKWLTWRARDVMDLPKSARFGIVEHCKATAERAVCSAPRRQPPVRSPPAEPKDTGSPRKRELSAKYSGQPGSPDVSIPTRRGTIIRGQEHCSGPTADLIVSLLAHHFTRFRGARDRD
jgi:hypothetical protein